jgi:anaerobic selenocysteine-containing dehydrogenase
MERVPTYCALCISRCGATAIVDHHKLVALEPDPSHPTGEALCIKGKVAPELVEHPERLEHPLKRTRPKGDRDPGWQRISWDEALATAATRLQELARAHGPETVVFSCASPSTSATADAMDWIVRLRRAFGSPNLCISMELCGWGRHLAPLYTYGAPVPGAYMPDLEHAGCILYWGYNPSVARLAHATATSAALKRGARLIVVDPRRAGLAHKADEWLRVRPGTDTALALAIAHVMIERGWFDREFVTRWTNGPMLVRCDNGRLLREGDRPRLADDLALFGEYEVPTPEGPVRCRPAFQVVSDACARVSPDDCGVSAEQIERTARLLWEARPVAYYAWSGVEQHCDATQMARAIGQLYALTGSLDAPGGNVLFPAVPTNPVAGDELLAREQRAKALGLPTRPLGPSRFEFVTSEDLYTGALEGKPYRVRGLVGFGANLLLAHADSARGRAALAALDFYLHADLFMTPTAELADIVLPVTSPFESEALKLGFEISEAAQSLVQLRRPLVPPRGEARSDLQIVFALAQQLGLGQHFWDGDVDAGLRHQLAPSGLTLERLRAEPAGVRVPLATRHRKFVERGFNTPSRTIELYSETLLAHGYPPVPEFAPPPMRPRDRYPLVLTSAKSNWFCESQHRGLPSLRRRAPDPQVELHPDTARVRGIAEGDWVAIETPEGRVRARAKLNADLDPGVVCGQHGWWQACAEVGAPAFDPFGPDGANLNLIVSQQITDPISGSVPMRSYLCEVVTLK